MWRRFFTSLLGHNDAYVSTPFGELGDCHLNNRRDSAATSRRPFHVR